MNTCTSTVESCIPERTWIRFEFLTKGYESRPVKTPPPGPWWEVGHGLRFVDVVAYIPLRNSTPEAAEALLREYWPDVEIIDSQVRDRIRFNSQYSCPSWWKDDGSLVSC